MPEPMIKWEVRRSGDGCTVLRWRSIRIQAWDASEGGAVHLFIHRQRSMRIGDDWRTVSSAKKEVRRLIRDLAMPPVDDSNGGHPISCPECGCVPVHHWVDVVFSGVTTRRWRVHCKTPGCNKPLSMIEDTARALSAAVWNRAVKQYAAASEAQLGKG